VWVESIQSAVGRISVHNLEMLSNSPCEFFTSFLHQFSDEDKGGVDGQLYSYIKVRIRKEMLISKTLRLYRSTSHSAG